MDQFDDNEIAKLLRLKRYEQPPPGYFENFLHEFHRRQRDELLRQPLWQICLDRARDFMLRLNVPALSSYPAAVTAVLVCAAVLSLRIYQAPEPVNVAAHNRPALTAPVNTDAEWTLASPVATLSTHPLRNSNQGAHTHSRSGTPPRYVLDSVPVSYETAFRF
ncbi:MAG: hypothetical protein M3R29_07075 [Verrucomicrobiota bacterium]|nr:hypothetical protein [Verrucomicrobiota bacterium]